MTKYFKLVPTILLLLFLSACSNSEDSKDIEPDKVEETAATKSDAKDTDASKVAEGVIPDIETSFLANPYDGRKGHPPAGQIWEKVEVLTDEFNGDKLDEMKWDNYHPHWVGREPSHFSKDNVSQKDGKLLLRSTAKIDKIPTPEEDPTFDYDKTIWVNSAAVVSKGWTAQPGYYYESSFKASELSMTSSFWFRVGKYSEIDVVEQLGHPSNPDMLDKQNKMLMNTHVYGTMTGASTPRTWDMPYAAAEDYHVYGLWWKSGTELLFYHNGELVQTIEPSVPFEENLKMVFDTEVFKWEGYPLIENLNDPAKNVMSVDFVRTYKIVEQTEEQTNALVANGDFEEAGTGWKFSNEAKLMTHTDIVKSGTFSFKLSGNSLLKHNTIPTLANTDYNLSIDVKMISEKASLILEGIGTYDLSTGLSEEWKTLTFDFNSANKTSLVLAITTSEDGEVLVDNIVLNKK